MDEGESRAAEADEAHRIELQEQLLAIEQAFEAIRAELEQRGELFAPRRRPDIVVEAHGSLVLLRPRSSDGSVFLEEYARMGVKWVGAALLMEPRYIVGLLQLILEEGLDFESALSTPSG